jgi:hypothetical protein
MNKLQLRAARPRTASTFHRRTALNGAMRRLKHAVPATPRHDDACVRHGASLRAQWFRNTVTGVLECRWVADAITEPPMHRGTVHGYTVLRMPRRTQRADMRPPSRQLANG